MYSATSLSLELYQFDVQWCSPGKTEDELYSASWKTTVTQPYSTLRIAWESQGCIQTAAALLVERTRVMSPLAVQIDHSEHVFRRDVWQIAGSATTLHVAAPASGFRRIEPRDPGYNASDCEWLVLIAHCQRKASTLAQASSLGNFAFESWPIQSGSHIGSRTWCLLTLDISRSTDQMACHQLGMNGNISHVGLATSTDCPIAARSVRDDACKRRLSCKELERARPQTFTCARAVQPLSNEDQNNTAQPCHRPRETVDG
ncbi:hypothetical protein BC835DRAFT_1308880 [Cytidiella melzeri]|nr:hypothetical protein BC835DRAFT_1308880 [Cytidiella melzeri]